MVSLKTLRSLGAATVASSIIGSGTYGLAARAELPEPAGSSAYSQMCSPPWQPVRDFIPAYDFEARAYLKSRGGLKEDYLDKSRLKAYRQPVMVEYLEWVDDQERDFTWQKLEKDEAVELAALITDTTMELNLETIMKVSKRSNAELSSQEQNLKSLLDELDKYWPEPEISLDFMYSLINLRLENSGRTFDAGNILDVLNGEPADCNDISAVMASVLNFYGIPAEIKIGYVKKHDDPQLRAHAWLTVLTEQGTVDLDPTWYPLFAPLEAREGETIKKYLWELKSRHGIYDEPNAQARYKP